MQICETCLRRNNWAPSEITNVADCDWCWDRSVNTHSYPGGDIPNKPDMNELYLEAFEFEQQRAYLECQMFEVYFVNGHARAGQIDRETTQSYMQLLAVRGHRRDWLGIDWVATKKRFDAAKKSYEFAEEQRISRRIQ